ncbi:hypothetical protein [Streptomyces phaeochromogenes]|uniref:hypothetical protein n=1 Tax=Streptomyces phaeochromogenes TaxID=1923 RepID=UPI0037109564
MVDPMPPCLSTERVKHLQQLADASQVRAALYPSPKPLPVRRLSRRYPGGRPNRGGPRACADATSGQGCRQPRELKDAAKKIHRSAARRAVEAQPDTAVPLIQEIEATLQQIDGAVAIRLPKPE